MITDTARYPLRDIHLTVQDDLAYSTYKSKFRNTAKDSGIYKRDLMIYMQKGFSFYSKEFRIPFRSSTDYQVLFTENVNRSTHLKYTVDITWSNGDLAYYIECYKVNDGWTEKRTCYDRINQISVSE